MAFRRPDGLTTGLQSMHDLCMATKTISLEIDAYAMLKREKRRRTESFSDVVRRMIAERPAETVLELEKRMAALEGHGAGPRTRRRRARS